MKSVCPCCGAMAEATLPRVSLDTNAISWGNTVVTVQKQLAEIMTILVTLHPAYASADRLVMGVWGVAENNIGDAEGSLRVQITRLRKVLKPFGFSIDVRYNTGWRLERIADITDGNIGHTRVGRPRKVAPL